MIHHFGHFRTQKLPRKFTINISADSLSCESNLIKNLEHVQLKFDLNYTLRAILAIDVQSQSGTTSRFIYPRTLDTLWSPTDYNDMLVTSIYFWGETLLGVWTVDIKESGPIRRNGAGIS